MNDKISIWADNIWAKIDTKMKKVAQRSENKLPYTTLNGVHNDLSESNITWWTNGFWPALMWLLYADTKNEQYAKSAKSAQVLLHKAFEHYDGLHHDVGFMWHISSGMEYRLTGDKSARLEAMYAANVLAGRYNAVGEYIRAWNNHDNEHNTEGWAIIDCMMNIPLLYWASEEFKDKRFATIAVKHANKTLQHHVRTDGSVRHIVEYDTQTGDFVKEYGGQGYAEGSSWSRGQAWGLYGFVLSYLYTKDEKYLDTAKRIAQYFISCVCNDWLPRCDFRSPIQPTIYDSTAGAIAACGLLELAGCVEEYSAEPYKFAALQMLQAMEREFCDWDEATDAILTNGTERYHAEKGRHIPIVYGDFFFTEAIYKLRGNTQRSW
jgi:unsaturated chondroitin disaccharide hydrolase